MNPVDPGGKTAAESETHAEQVALLFEQSYHALFTGLAIGLLLLVLLWQVQEHTVLVGWYAVILVAGAVRLAVFQGYRRASPEDRRWPGWERRFVASATVYFLLWGLGAVYITPADSYLHAVILMAILVGMAASALAIFSANRRAQLLSMFSLLCPMLVWFALQGDATSLLLAGGLTAFLVSVLRSSKVVVSALQENLQLKHSLLVAKSEAEALARVDELTGLYNRRAFYMDGEKLLAHCERNENDLSAVVVDIDHFKQINDQYGHQAGDAVLRQLGILFGDKLRTTDLCGRLGGEEFGLLLPGASLKAAAQVAENLRRSVAENTVQVNGTLLEITASFGVAELGLDETLEQLVQRADAALYEAKHNGRNQVVCNSRRHDSSAPSPGE